MHSPPDMTRQASLNLILTYVGRLPNYFDLFLRSCGTNPTIAWTVLTDQARPPNLPPNVRWEAVTIPSLCDRVNAVFGIRPAFSWAYKICDFRPALAKLYPELVAGYDFWGHCDPDVIWGDLRKFYPLDIASTPPKVQIRGAFSVYRNDAVGNSLFELPHPQISHRDVFRNPRYCFFDEWHGLWRLIRRHGIPFLGDLSMAEIRMGHHDLRLDGSKTNPTPQVFYWQRGRALRAYWTADTMKTDEFTYIHLQKRHFQPHAVPEGSDFCILPGRIVPIGDGTDLRELAEFNRPRPLRDVWYQLGRPRRYLKSRQLFDRTYRRIRN